MKKMTAKEFKAALDKAGFEINIFGYETILNVLIMKLYDDARDLEADNKSTKLTADHLRKQADVLYNILEARGYYND